VYDALTGYYTFHCPSRGAVRVRLSGFRLFEHLAGTRAPAVFKVTFACGCGEEHDGLVTHTELDWEPLGGADARFYDLMTARLRAASDELLDLASRMIRSGRWPWSFFCFPEGRPRPTFPSTFRLLSPGQEAVGLAVRCPDCGRTSVNLVTRDHVDVPFYNDERVAVVEHVFASDAAATLDAFREELGSSSFDARLRRLAA
jgi:hypothetical protein